MASQIKVSISVTETSKYLVMRTSCKKGPVLVAS